MGGVGTHVDEAGHEFQDWLCRQTYGAALDSHLSIVAGTVGQMFEDTFTVAAARRSIFTPCRTRQYTGLQLKELQSSYHNGCLYI